MLKVLVIDDDGPKRRNISTLIKSVPEMANGEIAFAEDLVAARDLLTKRYFDLLILDIVIPPTRGARPDQQAGISFVTELRLSNSLIKPANIIGLTAHDYGLTNAAPVFVSELWALIKYDPISTDWGTQLRKKLLYLVVIKKEIRAGENASYDFDLGIVTAMWKPELQAILNLPLTWDKRNVANDGTTYHIGRPKMNSIKLQVVAASCSQMGIAPAAVLSAKLIHHFRPRFLCIAGIAAGVKGNGINLGDILIAEQSWDYESGKRRLDADGNPVHLPDPHHIPIHSELRDQFAACIGRKAFLSDVQNSWSGSKPNSTLKAFLGPIGCGSAVIQDQKLVASVQTHARKLIGIDMETYGVFYSSENCCKPRPKVLAIKSVVDFADDEKGDSFHEYAAFTSAEYLWRFSLEHFTLT